MTPRARLAWKLLASIVGVLLLSSGLLWLWLKSVETRKWAAMERRVAELAAASFRMNPERRPLGGPETFGNGWEEYLQALAGGAGGQSADEFRTAMESVERLRARMHPPPEELEPLLAPRRAALQMLRRGARRATAAPPVEWTYPTEFQESASAFLASLMACEALALRDAERSRDAMDLLLDLAQFGVDLDRAGWEVASLSVYARCLDAMGRLVASQTLTSESVEALREALDRFDPAVPTASHSLQEDIRRIGSDYLHDPETVERSASFRGDGLGLFGFSKRHFCADTFLRLDGWAAGVAASQALPYGEALERIARIREEIESCPNGLGRVLGKMTLNPNRHARREVRARLRVLRAACGAPDLDDPFGMKIRRSGFKVWSVGPDGLNDGGDGGWKNGHDIVLELNP